MIPDLAHPGGTSDIEDDQEYRREFDDVLLITFPTLVTVKLPAPPINNFAKTDGFKYKEETDLGY